MASTDLLFGQALNLPSGSVEIVFGDDDDGGLPPGGVELQAAGRITGLRGYVAVRTLVRAKSAGRITGLRGHVDAVYDINVERPLAGTARTSLQQAQRTAAAVLQRYERARAVLAGVDVRWQDARTIGADLQARWQQSARVACAAAVVEQQAVRLGLAPVRQGLQQADRRRTDVRQGMQQAVRLATATRQGMQQGVRLRAVAAQRFEGAVRLGAAVRSAFRDARQLGGVWATCFEQAGPPGAGITVPVVPPQPEPCYVPGLPTHLLFDLAADGGLPAHLVFRCDRDSGPEPSTTVIVPVRRVYIVINQISLHRVDTGAALHAHSFSLSLDYQSWTWSWSASLHHDAGTHLGRDASGAPAEVVAMVNGTPFRLRIERIVQDRRFLPQSRWAVSGKGRASILAAPYAPTQTFSNTTARTAQQLAADVLTVNGVGMGWALDWQIADWLVPAGAWSVQGSYIEAINDIAMAAGGYVQPHATAATLRVLPRYPVEPWAWSGVTPDFEIPGAAAEVVGIEHVDKPAYDRVFVGGVGAGVFGPFKRAGMAGTTLAPAVNHALITHVDVHRARGIAELSDTGRQEHVTLRMQVLPETGVIVPGQFVRHTGDRARMGIVRSISIEWSRPTLRQTIGIETHAD